jgi:MFS transporter
VRRARPALLSNRNFRLFFLGQATSTLGNAFTSIALAFAVLQTTGSAADVGFALAATRTPLLLFVLLGGVVGDRVSRRAVMLASDAVRFGSQGVGAALLITGRARFWELIVVFAIHGFAQAFFNPASIGLVPALAPDETLQEANALLDFARNGAGIVGLLVGGAAVTVVGPGPAFAIDSGSFLVSALALGAIHLPATRLPAKTAATIVADLRSGWAEFSSRNWLWIGTLHVSLFNAFALVAFFALGPVVAARDLGGGYARGLIGAGFTLGMIGGSAVALRVRPRRALRAAVAAIALAAPLFGLLAVTAPLPLVAFGAFLGGGQSAFWGALWTTSLQREIPPAALARVASYSQMASLVLAPAGFALVGFAAARVGVAAILWFGAAWTVGSTAAVLALPSIRTHEMPPAGAASLAFVPGTSPGAM